MKTITATEARKNLYRLLHDVAESSEPVQITSRGNEAILVSGDDWRAIEEPSTCCRSRACGSRSGRGWRRRWKSAPKNWSGEVVGADQPWRLVFTRHAKKDAKKLKRSGLCGKAEDLLSILREDPHRTPPSYKRLVGDLRGALSRRINIQHRLVYQVLDEEPTV